MRSRFYQDLDKFVENADFKVIATAIIKDDLIKAYGPKADNPYDLSLTFLLERSVFLAENNDAFIQVIAEARGKKEDASLQSQHQLILSNGTGFVSSEKFKKRISDITFSKKRENNLGIQLSDLVAYPLATKILYPERENLAFRVIESKMYRQFPKGDYLGYGLKIFP